MSDASQLRAQSRFLRRGQNLALRSGLSAAPSFVTAVAVLHAENSQGDRQDTISSGFEFTGMRSVASPIENCHSERTFRSN